MQRFLKRKLFMYNEMLQLLVGQITNSILAQKGLGYCYNLKDVVDYYRLYIDLMEFWQSQYNNRIYNLNYEELTTNQENETKNLIKHLDLNWEEACLSPHLNKRSVRTASQQQVRQKVYKGSSEAWRKYEPYLKGAFDNLRSLNCSKNYGSYR